MYNILLILKTVRQVLNYLYYLFCNTLKQIRIKILPLIKTTQVQSLRTSLEEGSEDCFSLQMVVIFFLLVVLRIAS